MNNLPKPSGKLMLNLLRYGVAFLTLGYIAYRWRGSEGWDNNGIFYEALVWPLPLLLFAVLSAMVVNWGIESWKWYILSNKIEKTSYIRAVKGVLCGSAISFWMPNRTGDYIGRILYMNGNNYGQAVICAVTGNFAQFITTVFFGCIGLAWFLSIQSTFSLPVLVSPVLFVAGSGLTLLYFNFHKLERLLPETFFRIKLRSTARVLKRFSTAEKMAVLLASAGRYLVFATQFVLLLWAFQVNAPIASLYSAVFIVFLVQSTIPSFALTEVGVRGAASVFFIGVLSFNEAGILMATYSLWVINLLLPAAVGAFLIAKAKKLTPEHQTAGKTVQTFT